MTCRYKKIHSSSNITIYRYSDEVPEAAHIQWQLLPWPLPKFRLYQLRGGPLVMVDVPGADGEEASIIGELQVTTIASVEIRSPERLISKKVQHKIRPDKQQWATEMKPQCHTLSYRVFLKPLWSGIWFTRVWHGVFLHCLVYGEPHELLRPFEGTDTHSFETNLNASI